MSRSGYSDDCDGWALIRWRGAVAQAIRGKRGQAMLRELVEALDAMPDKRLVKDELEADGEFCALGVLGKARGLALEPIDPENRKAVANAFGIAEALAAEVMFENDDCLDDDEWLMFEIHGPMRPGYPDWDSHTRAFQVSGKGAERRWRHVREWAAAQIERKTP